jgi:capsid protein
MDNIVVKEQTNPYFLIAGAAPPQPQPHPVRNGRQTAVPDGLLLNASFDSAQTTTDNMNHWAAADRLSPDAAATPAVRQTLRNRTRYEAGNNPLANGMRRTGGNYLIQRGPTLQLLAYDKRWQTAGEMIERSFSAWSKRTRLARKLRIAKKEKIAAGEGFIQLFTNPKLKHQVQLDLMNIAADRVYSDKFLPQHNEIDGIYFDVYGNPEKYIVYKNHPGGNNLPLPGAEYNVIPAKYMIHLHGYEQAEEHRSVPELTPSLGHLADTRRYVAAVIAAAEQAAALALILQTQGVGVETPDDVAAFATFATEKRMGMALPYGWEAKQMTAEQPTATFSDTTNTMTGIAGQALSMPKNVACGDSSGYNFASGRLDHLKWYVDIDVERQDIEFDALEAITDLWYEEYRLLPQSLALLPSSLDLYELFDVRYIWPELPQADLVKAATAAKIELESNLTFLREEYAKRGKDFDRLVDQALIDQEKISQLIQVGKSNEN